MNYSILISKLDTEALMEAVKQVPVGPVLDMMFDRLEKELGETKFIAFCESL